jgi:CHAD domain-containing protein
MASQSAPVRSLCEVAAEVAAGGLRRLDSAAALTDEKVVHELRIATKRLRAAWRLAAGQAGRALAKDRRNSLAALAAKLSGTRDLTVLSRLARRLADAATAERTRAAFHQLLASLGRRHAATAPQRDSTNLLGEIRDGLAAEIAAWQALAESGSTARRRAARAELRRSRRRARRDAREARHSLDPDLWHDWRKTVKRLRYQRQWLALADGRQPRKFDARLHRLGARLGKRHDLANLTRFADDLLAAGDLPAAGHEQVREAIAAVESRLIRKCRRTGKRTLLRNR